MGHQIKTLVAVAAACITVIFAMNVVLTLWYTGRAWKISFGVTFAAANITAIARAWNPETYFGGVVAPGLLVAIFQYLWGGIAAVAAVWYAGLAAKTIAAIVLID